jgi:hypothetical protein
MRRLVIISILLLVCSVAFAEPDRRNTDCQWPQETAFPLDLRNPEQRRHLTDDADLAEDLAIRYADLRVGPTAGYGETRDQCMAALFSTIAKNHFAKAGPWRWSLLSGPQSS